MLFFPSRRVFLSIVLDWGHFHRLGKDIVEFNLLLHFVSEGLPWKRAIVLVHGRVSGGTSV